MFQIVNDLGMEIVLVLLKGKSHVREIARTTKQSPATVLRKLSNLSKNNIVDYKNEGKNNVYFIKNNLVARQVVYRAENYKLIKLLHKYPQLTVILDEVLKKTDEELIILFGSYAKFSAKEDSDIDIYIESKDNSIRQALKTSNSKINGKNGVFDKDSLLIKEIIKNHVIIRGTEKFYEKIEIFK